MECSHHDWWSLYAERVGATTITQSCSCCFAKRKIPISYGNEPTRDPISGEDQLRRDIERVSELLGELGGVISKCRWTLSRTGDSR